MEAIFQSISKMLGMCGNGPDNNLWVRFADLFFVDCSCCLFWRGAIVGAASGAASIGIAWAVLSQLL